MAERRRSQKENKKVFREDGERLFLGGIEVFTSVRSLPERTLLGFSCSGGDYFKSSDNNEYYEVLRDFGNHVQNTHVRAGQALSEIEDVHLERVYRAGSQKRKGPRG